MTITVGKSSPNILTTTVNYQNLVQGKNSPKRRKFAQKAKIRPICSPWQSFLAVENEIKIGAVMVYSKYIPTYKKNHVRVVKIT
jgi:hypothetical protein